MSKITIQTDNNFYQAIKNHAKKQGISIDDFIKNTLMNAINSNDKKDNFDFQKELNDSCEEHKEILRILADK